MTNYCTKSPKETIALGKKLAVRLRLGDTILLFGDLGAGKTCFVKGVAAELGIKETIKSPTYVYVNKYSLKCECEFQVSAFYHYDLYRLSAGDDFASIGLEETMQYPNSINIIEWADRLNNQLPDRFIAVYFSGSGNKRNIQIKFISPTIVPAGAIPALYRKWVTPLHIKKHCRMVTKAAMRIADEYIRKGEIINTELLYSACMLHDLNRVCDIRQLKRDKFEEKVTEEKWRKWEEMRKKYHGTHHADITYRILYNQGFTDTAEVIRLHMSKNIVLEPKSYNTLEKKIMHYADKRVKHSKIVNLKERFRDGHERYGKFDTAQNQKFFRKVQKATFALEEELFEGLDIKTVDIR